MSGKLTFDPSLGPCRGQTGTILLRTARAGTGDGFSNGADIDVFFDCLANGCP